jgi:hypothetical protein
MTRPRVQCGGSSGPKFALQAVAAEAGVSMQTVLRVFGSKGRPLNEVSTTGRLGQPKRPRAATPNPPTRPTSLTKPRLRQLKLTSLAYRTDALVSHTCRSPRNPVSGAPPQKGASVLTATSLADEPSIAKKSSVMGLPRH